MGDKVDLKASCVHILAVSGEPKSLLKLGQADLDPLRAGLLKPLGVDFRAPNKTALYLFRDGSRVIENFNDEPVEVQFNGNAEQIPARGWAVHWK